MTYRLTATISHKTFDEPVIKEIYFTVESKDDALDQIKRDAQIPDHLSHMIHNLKHHGRCAFKDARGVKHTWDLELMETMN